MVYGGGPLVVAPKVVTITFPGDTLAPQLQQLGASITSSAYWDAVRAGYCENGTSCIGRGPAGTSVVLSTPAARSYTDSEGSGSSTMKTFLSGLINDGTVPAPDANTIYLMYFPSTTTLTLDTAQSCTQFGGYHGSMQLGGQNVIYAAVSECVPPAGSPRTVLQETTVVASHEIAEASTDPGVADGASGYYLDFHQQKSWAWNGLLGGEVGDMCEDFLGLGQDETTVGGFSVQRIWSTLDAQAGKNPCVPVPAGEVYFNAFPDVSAVVVDVGKTQTITVEALADGPMDPWLMLPRDFTDPTGATRFVSYKIAGGTTVSGGPAIQMKSGDKVKVDVTLTQDPSQASETGWAKAVLISVSESGAPAGHLWPFMVMTPAQAHEIGVTMAAPVLHLPRTTSHRRVPPHFFDKL